MAESDVGRMRLCKRRVWAAAGAVLVVGLLGATSGVATADSKVTGLEPPALLDRARNGADALRYIGANLLDLSSLASKNKLDITKLTDILRSDDTAWLDRTGRLYFVEPAPPAVAAVPVPAQGPFPYASTFSLHSRPGAARVLYLDFNGHTVSGTGWNASYNNNAAFTVGPFDNDGNSASFSNAEQDIIQQTWQRVAEDYAPFELDVTTEEPSAAAIDRTSAADDTFGTRLVVTGRTSPLYAACSCGGIAYVGVFDEPGANHAYYQPAFVFTSSTYTAKDIAEAGSHEVGHNLGLSHDGNASTGYFAGQGSWAPIMGVGYYRPITQWSKGEYSGANNTQDDLSIMVANGAPTRADDHGDTTAQATTLTGPTLSASGIITSRTDVDVFRFQAGAGPATISVKGSDVGSNLDIRADLLDSAGNVLVTVDPPATTVSEAVAAGLEATISWTLTAGTYFLRIDGVGYGTALSTGFSDYASLGQYQVSGTIPTGGGPTNQAPTAKITATPTSGSAPVTVAFSSVGSADPDGSIATFTWAFGDSTASNLPNPSKTYSSPGTFTAQLTVTDNLGATGSATQTITVTATTNPVIRVESITLTSFVSFTSVSAQSTVRVTDLNGMNVSGVTVRGTWSGGVSGTVVDTTGTDGIVRFNSSSLKRRGTFTFTVNSLSKTGYTFDATKNKESTKTLIVP